ncbi:ABC transporter substrate-binding protein [Halorubrum sp. CSM-61]|uniref:ABC transporter substrate-binding protein n=1 Tax=Halorubrum sp. CSM-61 TaxID=2485838 RepID=UPI000F4B3140|nr:ABC transporter substrate-binding protein [Halorubrum sp. CSM-61]
MRPSDNTRRRTVLKRAGGGALGAASLSLLAGCADDGGGDGDGDGDGSGNGDGDDGDLNSGDVGDNPVRIGFLIPQTGIFAAQGEAMERGAETTLHQLNEEVGGILDRDVAGFIEDTEGDPGQGRDMARRHVETNDVDVLIGAVSGAVNLSIADYAHDEGVPYFAYGGPEEITGSECRPTTFRYQYSDSQIARTGAKWALENLGENVWIHVADYAFGQSISREWKKAFEASDLEYNIVDETQTPLGHDDYSSVLSQIQSSEADWVLQGFSGSDAVNFLSQSTQFGLEQDIMSTTNTYRPLREGAGSSAVGTYTTIRYEPTYDTEANQTLVDLHTELHDQPPTDFALVIWSSLLRYAEAAEAAGSVETEAIIGELEGMESEEPMGPATMRECDHQAMRKGFVGRITEPNEHDWPGQEIVGELGAEEVTRPCTDTGCEMPDL